MSVIDFFLTRAGSNHSLLCLVLLTCFCAGGGARCAGADATLKSTAKSKGTDVVAEENLGTMESKLGTSSVVVLGTFDVGVRVIIWRNITDDGIRDARARVSFGTWGKEGILVAVAGKQFTEDSFAQFTADGCRTLIQLVDRLASIKFTDPGDDIKYRDVQANYQGVRLRRYPERPVELYVMRNEAATGPDNEVWVSLDTAEFKKFFGEVVERLERFNKRPATIKLN